MNRFLAGAAALTLATLVLNGCQSNPAGEGPSLGVLYRGAAEHNGPMRNPVVVIPGLIGSKLAHESGKGVWGAFGGDYLDPETPEGARLFALPFATPADVHVPPDGVHPTGALDTLSFDVLGIPFQLSAYVNVLRSLGVGGFRDQMLGDSGAVDYGPDHYTCFQFAYDWRRSNVWNAKLLHRFLVETKAYVERENRERFGWSPEVKFDIVAHSMGGWVTRYYLRYGDADLPAGDQPPRPTWKGAELVERAILVGTPNGGSANSLLQLVNGVYFAPFLPEYPPALIGTLESGYELMTRPRHARVVDARGEPIGDLYDPELWIRQEWGLADPGQDELLRWLLPKVESAAERREIALGHLRRVLANTKRLHQALDVPSEPPPGLELFLIAGDAVQTTDAIGLDPDGALEVKSTAPGDGTVTRASALLDERLGKEHAHHLRLESPIHWRNVQFLFSDHIGLTKDPAFTDNVLYLLLEAPRRSDAARRAAQATAPPRRGPASRPTSRPTSESGR